VFKIKQILFKWKIIVLFKFNFNKDTIDESFWKHKQQDDFIIKAEDGIFGSWILFGIIPNV
jgi:hypothetical protein